MLIRRIRPAHDVRSRLFPTGLPPKRSKRRKAARSSLRTFTLASVTFQNYFRLYNKARGMTGTREKRSRRICRDLTAGCCGFVPTNVPVARVDEYGPKSIRSRAGKISGDDRKAKKEANAIGQTVLVGTTSIRKVRKFASARCWTEGGALRI